MNDDALDEIKILGRLFRIYMCEHVPDEFSWVRQRMMLLHTLSGSPKNMIELM